MMTHDTDKKRGQYVMTCMDDLVPRDYMLRKIARADLCVPKSQKLAKMKDRMGLLDGPDNCFSTEKMIFLSKNTK